MNNNEQKYFKLIKLSETGDKIGYFNSNLDPESSWPTKDVDQAQILTTKQVQSVMMIENLKKKRFNTQYQIHKIEV